MEKLNRFKRSIRESITKLETFVQENLGSMDTSTTERKMKLKNLQTKLYDLREKYEIPDIRGIEEMESNLDDAENRLEEKKVSLNIFLASIKNYIIIKNENKINTNSKTNTKLSEIPLSVCAGKYQR
ncbi:hypothetical protein NPIL_582201 [Nephila pilipes]|uniref:Uncharacterized protein n=1 Tax=Nephila pilipes TaxID=299642 RepID=A0A8X6TCS6_NEPPI|nr:hypothetical protein NPIL_582201 [Nephila pilipes]